MKNPNNKQNTLNTFITTLTASKVNAAISQRQSELIINATDNSIYESKPAAVIYPKTAQAIQDILTLGNQENYQHLHFTAKGGATGCNGQSLNTGIIIDVSRFMHAIGEINIEEEWVMVEPGVTLAELNDFLKPYNYHFAPNVSPADRATIGGMFSTDASGKGSMRYGKTSQHILECDIVNSTGEKQTLKPISISELTSQPKLHQKLYNIAIQNQQKINKTFPTTTRFLTGYNLKHMYNPKTKTLSLIPLFSGSEGTLGIVTRLKLKLSPIPKKTSLIVIGHPQFSDAISCIEPLKKLKPIAIEVLDDTVLRNASDHALLKSLNQHASVPIQSLSYVELDENSNATSIKKTLINCKSYILTHIHVTNTTLIQQYWQLRKESVGTISKVKNNKQAIPFMEDHAVDPARLGPYIADIKAMLNKHNVEAGMYGHADIGCIHMRPALDLNTPEDQQKLASLQHEAIKIVKKHRGIIWAEHGKGFRHEALPSIFGDCYPLLKKIKTLLDPHNKLNPGKLVTPDGYTKRPFNSVGPLRDNHTPKLQSKEKDTFKALFHCNGNGLCHSSHKHTPMCPSYTYSRHKLHSPKGRAMLLKYWLQHLKQAPKPTLKKNKPLLEDIKNSLTNCLSCKACSKTCPVAIDIPTYKSHFFNWYYKRFKRPISHTLLALFEKTVPLQVWARYILNPLLKLTLTKTLLKKIFQLEHIPIPSTHSLHIPKHNKTNNTVFIIQDPFTRLYAPERIENLAKLCVKLDKKPTLLPYFEIGKSHEILGHTARFKQTAKKTKAIIDDANQKGRVLCIEPSMFYCFQDEYKKAGIPLKKPLMTLQGFLLENTPKIPSFSEQIIHKIWTFFPHCMEQTHPEHLKQWLDLFQKLKITIKFKSLGCCGQAGLYGYQSQNQQASQEIFEKGWGQDRQWQENILTSGFSCHHQFSKYGIQSQHVLGLFT